MSTPHEIAEDLKDVAFKHGLRLLKGSLPTGPDTWTTIEIREPSVLEDAPDGWVTTISHGGL